MEVTAIETVTRNRMRVFLDGEPAFIISLRNLEDLGIREGSSLSDEEAGELMKKVYRLAAMTAMELLVRRDHTRQELMRKLTFCEFFSVFSKITRGFLKKNPLELLAMREKILVLI